MPKYQANSILFHDGKVVSPGQTVELTADQATKLGDKVGPTEETLLEAKKVDELKELARNQGVEGYATMKKDELIQAVKAE